MSVFIGTFENKVDRKGRTSVPATFRQILATSSFQGIVAFRYKTPNAMEACAMEFLELLSQGISDYDLFSEDHDALAFSLFGDSHQLPFDGEGRVILPPALTEITGITDRAAFVGKGRTFQIWEPEALKAHKAGAHAHALAQNLTLKVPQSPPGGTS